MSSPDYRSSGFFWFCLLLVANTAYLIFELAFNSRIVDGATEVFSPELVDALEIQGRALSGLGLTLLLWRLLPVGKLGAIKTVMVASLVFVVAFSSMFYGQKALVEYFVDQSSGADRQDAQYLAMLKRGIATNAIQLDDIQIPAGAQDSPATKSFINIIGAMIYSSEAFLSHIKKNSSEIISRLADNESLKHLPGAYEEYTSLSDSVKKQFVEYEEASFNYSQAYKSALSDSEAKVNDIYEALGNEWQQSQAAFSREELIRKSLEIKRGLSSYFDGHKECLKRPKYEQRCLIKLEEVYRDKVVTEAGRYIAPDYWCHPPRKEYVTTTVRGKARVSTKVVQDCRSMSRDFIEDKLKQLSGGGSFSTFLNNPEVVDKVRQELSSSGVDVRDTWTLSEKSSLKRALTDSAVTEVEERYRSAIVSVTGEYISPSLSAKEFVASPVVQRSLSAALDEHKGRTIALNWSPEEFHLLVLKPKYVENYEEQHRQLLISSAELADGGVRAEQGRQYFRSIIVPPIAMGFSLFFGLLNLFALIAALLTLARVSAFKSKLISYSLGGLIFVVWPTVAPSQVVTSQAFNYFRKQMG